MNKHLRRTLPLLGAAALVSSALLTSSGAALAGKAPPVANPLPGSAVCDYRLDSYTNYRVGWDMTASKGKWLYAEAWLGGEDTNLDDRTVRFAKSPYEEVQAKLSGAPRVVTMVLQFYDRNGDTFGDPHDYTFVPPNCEP